MRGGDGMKYFTVKNDVAADKRVVADDMILTKKIPTTAGSKMLDGYVSLFEGEVLTRLADAGAAVLRTDEDGTVVFTVEADSIRIGK
jgi:hypothetical protein